MLLALVLLFALLPSKSAALPAPGNLLADITFTTGSGGQRSLFDSYALQMEEGDVHPDIPFDPDVSLDLPTSGPSSIWLFGGDDFLAFESLLTNGTADRIGIAMFSSSTSSYVRNWGNECKLFFDDVTCSGGIDFLGYDITAIHVETTIFKLDSPGRDPNEDGIWTDYNVAANVEVYGAPVPEPSTMLLLGTGLTGITGLARRRKS